MTYSAIYSNMQLLVDDNSYVTSLSKRSDIETILNCVPDNCRTFVGINIGPQASVKIIVHGVKRGVYVEVSEYHRDITPDSFLEGGDLYEDWKNKIIAFLAENVRAGSDTLMRHVLKPIMDKAAGRELSPEQDHGVIFGNYGRRNGAVGWQGTSPLAYPLQLPSERLPRPEKQYPVSGLMVQAVVPEVETPVVPEPVIKAKKDKKKKKNKKK